MTEEVQFFHHTSSNAKNIYNRKMDTKKFASPQFNYRDTGTAKLHVFIVEMLHERQCAQVLAHKSAQYAVTGTMQNAHAVNIAHYGIVKEIAHCLHSLLATHSANINILLEVQTFAMQLLLRLTGEERHLAHLFLGSLAWLQSIDGNC